MPSSINQIFNRKILNTALERVNISTINGLQQKQQILAKWKQTVHSEKLKGFGEVALHGVFLGDLFSAVLGYKQITEHPTEWNLVQEQKTQFDATKPDGALGFFTRDSSDTRVIIELKSADSDLDAKQHRKHDNRFNPWNYSDQNQLTTQFFQTLSTAIGRSDYGKDAKKAGEKLERLAKLFGPLKIIPEIGQIVGIFQDILKTTGEAAKSYGDSKSNDLHSIKTALNKLLDKLSRKIVIVIDDIDRLNNTEIRQTFQLIKSLGDFHNTVYLLAFDKNVVINALKKVQEGSGLEYLEKVVQVPFEIPLISKEEINRLLFSQINELTKDISQERWDQTYWDNLYYSGLTYFFNTIRDVTRYINSLRFSFSLVKEKVNTAEFFAITTFQVFIPEVYYGIRDNKHLFSGIFDSMDDGTREQAQKRCDEIIARTEKLSREALKEVLTRLFPKLQTVYGNIEGHHYDFLRSWRKQARICSPAVIPIKNDDSQQVEYMKR